MLAAFVTILVTGSSPALKPLINNTSGDSYWYALHSGEGNITSPSIRGNAICQHILLKKIPVSSVSIMG